MKVSVKKNLWSGIFAVAFGTLVWWQIPYQILSKRRFATAAVGPEYLPRIMAIVLVVLGIMLIVQSVALRKDKAIILDLYEEGRVLVAIAMMAVYVAVTPRLGFLWSSIAVNVLLLLYLRCRNWRYYLVIVAATAAVYFSFKYGLDVKLP